MFSKIGKWREEARPIIEKVLRDNAQKSDKEIRAALREAYPFGEKAYHPYKMWLKEIAWQTGKLNGARGKKFRDERRKLEEWNKIYSR